MKVKVEGRILWPHLLEEDRYGDFSCSILIPKGEKASEDIKKGINKLIKDDLKGKKPSSDGKIKIRDASDKLGDEFADYYIIGQCTSKEKVRLINQRKEPMSEDVSSGDHVRALLMFSAYTHQEYGGGISCFVNGVQFVAKGDSIGTARPTAAQIDDEFDEIDVPDDEVAAGASSEEEDFFS